MIVKSICRISAAEQLPEEHPVRKEKPIKGMDIYRGRTIDESLAKSGGNVQVQMDGKKFTITIPKNAKNGQRIFCKGLGNPGKNGGENGDLYIRIQIRRKKSKRGKNFYDSIEITDRQSKRGGIVRYKKMETEVIKVKILKGVKEGDEIRLEGQGYPGKNGGTAGDVYLKVHIKPEEAGITLFGMVWIIGGLICAFARGMEMPPAVACVFLMLALRYAKNEWLAGALTIAVWFVDLILIALVLSHFISVVWIDIILSGIASGYVIKWSYK